MKPTNAEECHQQCFLDYCRDCGCYMENCGFFTPKSGDVLLKSPLGTEQQACGNRAVTDNPTTIRVE